MMRRFKPQSSLVGSELRCIWSRPLNSGGGGGGTTVGAAGEQYVFGNIDLAQHYQTALKVRLGDTVEITSSVIDGNPGSALCAEAKRLDAEIIVVGSRRTQGMGRVLGSIASDVIKQAPCAVYVAQTSA